MLKNEKQQKMPEKNWNKCWKKTEKMLKNNDTIPYHPNKVYWFRYYFLENLTQYTIHTLIGV